MIKIHKYNKFLNEKLGINSGVLNSSKKLLNLLKKNYFDKIKNGEKFTFLISREDMYEILDINWADNILNMTVDYDPNYIKSLKIYGQMSITLLDYGSEKYLNKFSSILRFSIEPKLSLIVHELQHLYENSKKIKYERTNNGLVKHGYSDGKDFYYGDFESTSYDITSFVNLTYHSQPDEINSRVQELYIEIKDKVTNKNDFINIIKDSYEYEIAKSLQDNYLMKSLLEDKNKAFKFVNEITYIDNYNWWSNNGKYDIISKVISFFHKALGPKFKKVVTEEEAQGFVNYWNKFFKKMGKKFERKIWKLYDMIDMDINNNIVHPPRNENKYINKFENFVNINESKIYFTKVFKEILNIIINNTYETPQQRKGDKLNKSYIIATKLKSSWGWEIGDIDVNLLDIDSKNNNLINFTQDSRVSTYFDKWLEEERLRGNATGLPTRVVPQFTQPHVNSRARSVNDIIMSFGNQNSMRVGRIIRKLFKNIGISSITDNEIENFVNEYKSAHDIMFDENKEFKLVKGKEISEYYRCDRYIKAGGPLQNSCMRWDNTNEFIDSFYGSNPEKINLLLLLNKEDKVLGRAIVWNLDSPKITFMDRVYYSFDSDVNLFKKYARDMGWAYLDGVVVFNGENVYEELKVKLKDLYYKFPYTDTLKYFDPGTNILSNMNGPWELSNEDGGAITECEYCGGSGDDIDDSSEYCPDCDGSGTEVVFM